VIDGELSNKVALVTGAARGIGRAIALELAGMGAGVAINDVLESEAESSQVVQEISATGGQARLALGGVSDGRQIKVAVDSILQVWGKVDILINNAGISSLNSILRISEDEWDRLLNINLKGAFLCSKLVLPSMISNRWGRIVNLSSVAGLVGSMGRVDYAASKGGLIALTRSLAAEVGLRNITVNAVAPGYIKTRLTDDLPEEAKKTILAKTALKRAGTPQEASDLVAFLCTQRAEFITGQVIAVDGGIT
jgi:3-oxoacyl-[acyl-carrier protein] reductase